MSISRSIILDKERMIGHHGPDRDQKITGQRERMIRKLPDSRNDDNFLFAVQTGISFSDGHRFLLWHVI